MNVNKTIVIFVLVGLALLLLVPPLLAACGAACGPEKAQLKPQSVCPVLGGKVNKDVYVDVKGYRVYACCPGCLPKIKADPDKYLAKIKASGEQPAVVAAPVCQPCGSAKGSATCKAACAKAKGSAAACKGCAQPKGSPACKVACAVGKAAAKPAANVAGIDTPALAVLIKSGVPVVILDARSGKWDDGRRIPGAKGLHTKATAAQAAAVIPTKTTLVVTYCSSTKCPASGYLTARLRTLGYTNILEYHKGIDGWAAAGQPVVKATK